MCGIFGFAGPWSFRAASLFQALAISDEVRGRHSTGLAIVPKGRGSNSSLPVLVKKAVSGSQFVRSGFSTALFRNHYNLAIGHNRLATSGAINDRNAHPFAIPMKGRYVYGAKNGCVGGKVALAERFGIKDFPVDSEVFFRAIAKRSRQNGKEKGLLDAIEEVVSFVLPRADFACLWMEPARRTIYFFRSDDRPLVVFDARKVGLGRFFASTHDIFSNAWGMIRGFLPSINRISSFEVRPLSVYRVVDDGHWEVERIRDFKIDRRSSYRDPFEDDSRQQRYLPSLESSFDFDEEDTPRESQRVFLVCTACREFVEEELAVRRVHATGKRSSVGQPYHDDCLTGLETGVRVPPEVA